MQASEKPAQIEKDGHCRSTAGQPPTAEMFPDRPAQPVSARIRLIGSPVCANEQCRCKGIAEGRLFAKGAIIPQIFNSSYVAVRQRSRLARTFLPRAQNSFEDWPVTCGPAETYKLEGRRR